MKRNISIHLFSLLLSLSLGIYLWQSSDPLPFNDPSQEANIFWSHSVDIANQWRSFQFTLWHPEVAGGTSLYTAGMYPLWSPFNAFAWILNNDQFYLLMLILPYIIGFHFMLLILLEIFEIRWAIAIFGSLLYVGAILGRQTGNVGSPFFLWGIAYFPMMLYAYIKLINQAAWIRFAFVGALIALQFASAGVMQFLQTIVWWLYFIFGYFFLVPNNQPFGFKMKECFKSSAALLFFAFTLLGIQFIPSIYFVLHESIRVASHYTIGSWPIFSFNDHDSLFREFYYSFIIAPMGTSMRGIFALFIICVCAGLLGWGKTFQDTKNKLLLKQLWLACLLYLTALPFIEFLGHGLPFLTKIFSNFGRFTLAYGVHIIEACITIALCLIINNENLKIKNDQSIIKKILSFIAILSAIAVAALPVLLSLSFLQPILLKIPYTSYFITEKLASAAIILGCSLIIIFYLSLRPKNKLIYGAFCCALIALGFLTMLTSYKFNDKGQQTHLKEFLYDSPEHKFFRQAKGLYYLPYKAPTSMVDNYNLMHGVFSNSGRAQLPAIRYNHFLARYHNDIYKTDYGSILQYHIFEPSQSLTTYWPINFTTIEKDKSLPWSNFKKTISGDYYDVWERISPANKILFAHQTQIASLDEIISGFDADFNQVINVEEKDALEFNITEETLPETNSSLAQYKNFEFTRRDLIEFNLLLPTEIFVIVPQMYQHGWHIKANNKNVKPFPVNYLFIGFKLTAGEYLIKMQFIPPGFWGGLILSVVSLLGLIFLSLRFKKA